MPIERSKYGRILDKSNKSDEVTEERIYENLQIDGLEPPLSKIKEFIAKIKNRLNGPRTPESTS